MIRSRFAPSPTGDLHLGGAWTALAAWTLARRAGGAFVLRIEDLDAPRVVAGAAARLLDDLRWLGLDWDEGPDVGGSHAPYTQSQRITIYEDALARLDSAGRTYRCDCSRAEIERSASAPHAGEETIYSGRCRDRGERRLQRTPAVRTRLPEGASLCVEDRVQGPVTQRLDRDVGDFVLRRSDGVFAYQLAVVVDDTSMEISDVVRGVDLLASTPRQVWLAQALGVAVPRYHHVGLVTEPDGTRLAKRDRALTVRKLRDAGVSSKELIGVLAHGLGLAPTADPVAPQVLARSLRGELIFRRQSWAIPEALRARA